MAVEKDDDTRVGTTPPPQPKVPAGSPPTKAPPDEESDQTRIANAPPPIPKLRPPVPPAAAPPAAADQTHVASAPPPMPRAAPQRKSEPIPPPPPQSKPEPAPAGPAAPSADSEDDATVILEQRPEVIVRLQRLQPPGRSEIIVLDRTTYLLGRSHTCDIELFSPTASRTHAQLTNRDSRWYVAPVENRSVRVNGVAVKEEARLGHKARLQLGTDELLFLDESSPPTATESPAAPGSRRWRSALIAAVVVLLVAAAIWWILRP